MSKPDTLDERLSAAFRGFDVRPDFEARFVARLQAESQNDAAERARRARRLEQERYWDEKLELHSWRRRAHSIAELITLERLGVAALIVGAVAALWPQQEFRQYAPVLFTALGILVALTPVIATAVRQYRP